MDLQEKLFFHHFPYNHSSSVKWGKLGYAYNLHSFCYGHSYHFLFIRIHDFDALDLLENLFFPLFSLSSKFIYEMRQTWKLVIVSIFFLLALQSCSPYWDTRYWCSRFATKAFLSTIFLIIKLHSWNDINLDTHNNLHSFCSCHYNHVLHIGINDLDAFDLQEKLFFPPFHL